LCDISLFTASPQLDGNHTLDSFSTPNILLENENKSKEYDEGLEELKNVDTNACATTMTSLESKKNNTHCVSATPCMYVSAELQSPIIHASFSQSLVETSNAYALSWNACLPYDNENLCEPISLYIYILYIYITPMLSIGVISAHALPGTSIQSGLSGPGGLRPTHFGSVVKKGNCPASQKSWTILSPP
jgi:hypothetical protein